MGESGQGLGLLARLGIRFLDAHHAQGLREFLVEQFDVEDAGRDRPRDGRALERRQRQGAIVQFGPLDLARTAPGIGSGIRQPERGIRAQFGNQMQILRAGHLKGGGMTKIAI